MAIYAGVDTFWMAHDNRGRLHAATKGIVQDGLVLNLDAGVTQSYPGNGTTWTDLSGNGNNGTLTNGPTFTGDNGGGIVFDGADDRVLINPIDIGSIFTAFIWVKFNAYNAVLAGHISSGVGGYIFYVQDSNNIYASAGGYSVVSNAGLSTGLWTQLTSVRVGTSVSFYKNGIFLGIISIGSANNTLSSIGAYYGGNFALNGYIGSTLIYNRALSANEVQKNFNVTRKRFGI
jgi:hypothetical protein